MTQRRFTIVIAVKSPERGKSRLSSLPRRQRAAFARAFAADVIAVAVQAAGAGGVLVVSDDEGIASLARDLDAVPVVERATGLNPALLQGRDVAARLRPGSAIVALQGDLPAITLDDLSAAIAEAESQLSASFVPDATGTGTALLYWPDAATFRPSFGDRSAERHRGEGGIDLTADAPEPNASWAGLRRDVDTTSDLKEAIAIGVGPATRAVLDTEPALWDDT